MSKLFFDHNKNHWWQIIKKWEIPTQLHLSMTPDEYDSKYEYDTSNWLIK